MNSMKKQSKYVFNGRALGTSELILDEIILHSFVRFQSALDEYDHTCVSPAK